MPDYSETVTKLRDVYRAYVVTGNEKAGQFLADAAAAIEGLVESVHIRDKHLDELNQYIWKLEAEVKRLELDNEDYEYTLRERYDEPKRGEMYFLEYDNPETGEYEQTYFQCSVCGKYFYALDECEVKHFNYCPNCGAKMEVQDEQE